MMKRTNARVKLTVSLTIISVILGLMLSMQYKNTRMATEVQSKIVTVDPRAQYTAEQLKKMKEGNKRLGEELAKLTTRKFTLEKEAADFDRQAVPPELRNDLTKYKMMAGLLPIKGPGITFTVSDSRRNAANSDEAKLLILHDSDLRMIVNELLVAGAEAVSINDQRITTTTGIICIGPTVMINGISVPPPFEFKAIGAPQTLTTALEIKGGVLEVLTAPENQRFLSFSARKMSPSITIPGYAGDFNGLNK